MGLWKHGSFGQGWSHGGDTQLIGGFCHDCTCCVEKTIGSNSQHDGAGILPLPPPRNRNLDTYSTSLSLCLICRMRIVTTWGEMVRMRCENVGPGTEDMAVKLSSLCSFRNIIFQSPSTFPNQIRAASVGGWVARSTQGPQAVVGDEGAQVHTKE